MGSEEKAEKVKGFRVTEEFLAEINKTIKASGENDTPWLKSVMALKALHDIKKVDPSIESDLDDLVKCFNRAYHIVIRQHQKAMEQMDEVKEQNQDDIKKMEEDLRELKEELAEQKRIYKSQSNELKESHLKNQELTQRMIHFDQVTSSYGETIRLKDEKISNMETRIASLIAAEDDLALLKEEVAVMANEHATVMEASKLAEFNYRSEIEKLSAKADQLTSQFEMELQRKKEDHKKELEMQAKEIRNEAKSTLLTEKELWQEKTNNAIAELNQKHNTTVNELLHSFSETGINKKDDNQK